MEHANIHGIDALSELLRRCTPEERGDHELVLEIYRIIGPERLSVRASRSPSGATAFFLRPRNAATFQVRRPGTADKLTSIDALFKSLESLYPRAMALAAARLRQGRSNSDWGFGLLLQHPGSGEDRARGSNISRTISSQEPLVAFDYLCEVLACLQAPPMVASSSSRILKGFAAMTRFHPFEPSVLAASAVMCALPIHTIGDGSARGAETCRVVQRLVHWCGPVSSPALFRCIAAMLGLHCLSESGTGEATSSSRSAAAVAVAATAATAADYDDDDGGVGGGDEDGEDVDGEKEIDDGVDDYGDASEASIGRFADSAAEEEKDDDVYYSDANKALVGRFSEATDGTGGGSGDNDDDEDEERNESIPSGDVDEGGDGGAVMVNFKSRFTKRNIFGKHLDCVVVPTSVQVLMDSLPARCSKMGCSVNGTICGTLTTPAKQRLLNAIIDNGLMRPTDNVLDLGGGTGELCIFLSASRAEDGHTGVTAGIEVCSCQFTRSIDNMLHSLQRNPHLRVILDHGDFTFWENFETFNLIIMFDHGYQPDVYRQLWKTLEKSPSVEHIVSFKSASFLRKVGFNLEQMDCVDSLSMGGSSFKAYVHRLIRVGTPLAPKCDPFTADLIEAVNMGPAHLLGACKRESDKLHSWGTFRRSMDFVFTTSWTQPLSK